ncbi:paraquat-inducible A family protein [Collimonas arenae]|uniref:Paraquat-inducible A family protein n=1 Tax=Collimonas arenae TaxID=279058 RepID=A0A127PQB9_9BURK|nr:paraquat-inducible protein A [Collimonas arenae]AMO99999.1 paraquat-inducible A family protein [Collimonas arenae]AMP09894.1 paraquat-inducible A family protein [Collimonas arenae]
MINVNSANSSTVASDGGASASGLEGNEDLPVHTAASLGMMSCHHCGTVWQEVREDEHCQRCGTALHKRKPDSIRRSWAFLIAACIMYIPANLMPVMITKTLLGVQEDTIMSGVIYFWVSGAWELAAIIFIASFLVPLFKLASLILLTLTAQRRSRWRRLERAKLYRLVEIIGRWSMLDVFVVSLLAGLVQIEGFAKITAGFGVLAFASVVVLTMLAALSFDPRLTWDSGDQELDEMKESTR